MTGPPCQLTKPSSLPCSTFCPALRWLQCLGQCSRDLLPPRPLSIAFPGSPQCGVSVDGWDTRPGICLQWWLYTTSPLEVPVHMLTLSELMKMGLQSLIAKMLRINGFFATFTISGSNRSGGLCWWVSLREGSWKWDNQQQVRAVRQHTRVQKPHHRCAEGTRTGERFGPNNNATVQWFISLPV